MGQPRYLTEQNIWRAFVSYIRANATLKSSLTGDVHEGIAAGKTLYPHLVWTPVVPGVPDDTWGSRTLIAVGDAVIVSRSQVEADNLAQLLDEALDEAPLYVMGHQTLICHRVGGIRDTDRDEEGRKVYRIGGSYEIWTNQVEGVRNYQFTIDATIA